MKFVILFFIQFLDIFLSDVNSSFLHNDKKLKINKMNNSISSNHTKKFYRQIFKDVIQNFKMIKANISRYTELFNLIDSYKDSNFSNNQFENLNKDIKLQDLIGNFNSSINQFHSIHKNFEKIYGNFDEFIKKDYNIMKFFRNKRKKNTMIFYNSLSMVMLSMLTGGLIGLVFILYFTSDNKDTEYK